MKPRSGLFVRVFLSVLATTLGAVGAVGIISRRALARAFDSYLAMRASMGLGQGMGAGRMMGGAERLFLASVNRGVLIGALIAVAAAAVAAYLIARHITRPIRDLETAALAFAAGDHTSRVEPQGPAEIVALSSAFNGMADSLSTAEELRRRLVADVAHELRNPIAAARAQAEGMADGVLPADRGRLASVAEDMVHLSSLVDDLQELALAEAGKLRYDRAEVDLGVLAAEECERATVLAGDGVTMRVALPASPVLVEADYRRISQVLRNLIGNALRHTASGSVTIEVGQRDGLAEVRVVDTGEGIPEADLPYVFERFYRADAARASSSGGAGLGLAISRRIIEDHGGSVFAARTPGGGATVGFLLPLL